MIQTPREFPLPHQTPRAVATPALADPAAPGTSEPVDLRSWARRAIDSRNVAAHDETLAELDHEAETGESPDDQVLELEATIADTIAAALEREAASYRAAAKSYRQRAVR